MLVVSSGSLVRSRLGVLLVPAVLSLKDLFFAEAHYALPRIKSS